MLFQREWLGSYLPKAENSLVYSGGCLTERRMNSTSSSLEKPEKESVETTKEKCKSVREMRKRDSMYIVKEKKRYVFSKVEKKKRFSIFKDCNGPGKLDKNSLKIS